MRFIYFTGLLLGLGLGCQPQVTESSLQGLGYSYVFLVTADAGSDPKRAIAAVGLSSGARLPSVELLPGEERFFIVTIKESDLRRLIPGLDARRIARLELFLDDKPPEVPRFTGDPMAREPFMLVAAPDATQVHGLENDEGLQADGESPVPGDVVIKELPSSRLAKKLTLKVPVVAEHCLRPSQTGLLAFGDRLDIYAPAGGYALIEKLIWLSDTRILVVGILGITWVDRDAPLPPYDPADAGRFGRWLRLSGSSDFAEHERISSAALSESVDSEGRQTLLVTSGIPGATIGDSLGRVRRAWLGPEGLQWQDTPPMPLAFARPGGEVVTLFPEEIELDGAGNAYVGTEEGRVWQGTITSTSFTFVLPQPVHFFGDDLGGVGDQDSISRIRRADDTEGSIIIGTEGGLHFRAPGQQGWDDEEYLRPVVLEPEPFRFQGIDTSNDSGQLRTYLGARTGEFLWKPSRSGIEYRPTLAYPPRFKPCSTGTSDGQLAYQRRAISALDYEDGFIHMIFGECSAMVLLEDPKIVKGEEAPTCITLVTPVEDVMDQVRSLMGDSTLMPIRQIFTGLDRRSALATRPGALAIGTTGGWIYVSEW